MNIIIIGASGFLGSTIYKELSEDSNNLVIGTYNHNQIDIKHVSLDVCNDLEFNQLPYRFLHIQLQPDRYF